MPSPYLAFGGGLEPLSHNHGVVEHWRIGVVKGLTDSGIEAFRNLFVTGHGGQEFHHEEHPGTVVPLYRAGEGHEEEDFIAEILKLLWSYP